MDEPVAEIKQDDEKIKTEEIKPTPSIPVLQLNDEELRTSPRRRSPRLTSSSDSFSATLRPSSNLRNQLTSSSPKGIKPKRFLSLRAKVKERKEEKNKLKSGDSSDQIERSSKSNKSDSGGVGSNIQLPSVLRRLANSELIPNLEMRASSVDDITGNDGNMHSSSSPKLSRRGSEGILKNSSETARMPDHLRVFGSKIKKGFKDSSEVLGAIDQDIKSSRNVILNQFKKPIESLKENVKGIHYSNVCEEIHYPEGIQIPTGQLYKCKIIIQEGLNFGSSGGYASIFLSDVYTSVPFLSVKTKKIKGENPIWNAPFEAYLFDDRCFSLKIICKSATEVSMGSATLLIPNPKDFEDYTETISLFSNTDKTSDIPKSLVKIHIECLEIESIQFQLSNENQNQNQIQNQSPIASLNNSDNQSIDSNELFKSTGTSNSDDNNNNNISLTQSSSSIRNTNNNNNTTLFPPSSYEIASSPKLHLAVNTSLRCSDSSNEDTSILNRKERSKLSSSPLSTTKKNANNRGRLYNIMNKKTTEETKKVSHVNDTIFFQSSIPPEMTLQVGATITIPFDVPNSIISLNEIILNPRDSFLNISGIDKFPYKEKTLITGNSGILTTSLSSKNVKPPVNCSEFKYDDSNYENDIRYHFILPEDKKNYVTIPFDILHSPCFEFSPPQIRQAPKIRFDDPSPNNTLNNDHIGLAALQAKIVGESQITASSIPMDVSYTMQYALETPEEMKARLFEERILKRNTINEIDEMHNEIRSACSSLGLSDTCNNTELLTKTTTYSDWSNWRNDFQKNMKKTEKTLASDVAFTKALENPVQETWMYCKLKFSNVDPNSSEFIEVVENFDETIEVSSFFFIPFSFYLFIFLK